MQENTQMIIHVRFEVITAVTIKNAVFWDVAPCSSCVNRRFGGTYCLHLNGRKIHERGTSVSRWLQTELPVENSQLYDVNAHLVALPCFPQHSYTGSGLLPAHPSLRTLPLPSPHYWFPMWPTLLPFLSLYSWLFSTGSSVCSHLLTLVPHSRIFLPWRWWRYVPRKHQFTQELHVPHPRTILYYSNYYLSGYKTCFLISQEAFPQCCTDIQIITKNCQFLHTATWTMPSMPCNSSRS
jgi:hypothetical protein